MPKFAANIGSMTTANTVDGAIGWSTVAGEAGEFVEFIMTGSGTDAAADTQHSATVDFSDGVSADIAGTAQVASQFDYRSAAGTLEVEVTILTEGAAIIAPSVILFGFNQRGGMRWAVPKGEGVMLSGDEANEDLEFRVISSAAGLIDATSHWWEP